MVGSDVLPVEMFVPFGVFAYPNPDALDFNRLDGRAMAVDSIWIAP